MSLSEQLSRPPIVPIDQIVHDGHFSAIAHFNEREGTTTWPITVPEPTIEALDYVPEQFVKDDVLWVSFFEPCVTGEDEHGLHIVNRRVGNTAIRTVARRNTAVPQFMPLEEVVRTGYTNPFMKAWLTKYMSDTTRKPGGVPTHPRDELAPLLLRASSK